MPRERFQVCTDVFVHALCASFFPSPRTLWGAGFGECTTCRVDSSPAWTCHAALSVYADIGGSGSDIVELDGEPGKRHHASAHIHYIRIHTPTAHTYIYYPLPTYRDHTGRERLGSMPRDDVYILYEFALRGDDALEKQ